METVSHKKITFKHRTRVALVYIVNATFFIEHTVYLFAYLFILVCVELILITHKFHCFRVSVVKNEISTVDRFIIWVLHFMWLGETL